MLQVVSKKEMKSSLNTKIPLLVNDFVIFEDICNFKCSYCLTPNSTLKKDSRPTKPDILSRLGKSKNYLWYEANTGIGEDINKVLDGIESCVDAPILKISGGEVFLIKNIVELFKEKAVHYSNLQVLTNGSLLNEELIREMAEISNINVQFTLDGHTIEMNHYRVKNQNIQNRLLRNIDLLIKYGIPLEINCVLTNKNTGYLDRFMEYLLKYEGKLLLLPYPVRGPLRWKYFPLPKQIKTLEKIVGNYAYYQGILPPKVYLIKLIEFLVKKKRTFRCDLPGCMFQSFNDGIVTPCPNVWTVVLGNVLLEESEDVFKRLGQERIYKLMLNERFCAPFCRQCYTPWDIINLYFQNNISIQTLCKIPLYNKPKIKRRLEKLKREVHCHNDYHLNHH